MANTILPCPELESYIAGSQCTENMAGMGEVIYVFDRSKVDKSKITRNNETYTLAEGWLGTGVLYKFECKRDSQQIQGEGQGDRKGFVITLNAVIEAVDKTSARILRSIQNLDLGYIIPGDGENQILYDPNKKVYTESGNLTSDTGAAAGDDRQTAIQVHLGPVPFGNLFIDAESVPTAGWDSLMEKKTQTP